MSLRWVAVALLVVALAFSAAGAAFHSRVLTALAWPFFGVAAIVIVRARRRW